jgi:hypothetical protein
MSGRRGRRDELVSETSAAPASLQAGEPSEGPVDEESHQTLISPDMDPYVAFQMGLEVGRALASEQQRLASAEGERTTEVKPEAEQNPAPHLQGGADHSPSGSTSHVSSKQANPGHFKSRHRSSTDQPPASKSCSPKKGQSVPDLDPRLKFHMAMNLMGEKTAREYLVWVFLNQETGQLPPGSEERMNQILERTLVRKRSEQAEPSSVWKKGINP